MVVSPYCPSAAEFQKLYKAYWETDASLAEINPLILTGSGDIIALDAKFNFDSNALFRHPEIVALFAAASLLQQPPEECSSMATTGQMVSARAT